MKITTFCPHKMLAYTKSMRFFVTATPAPEPKTKNVKTISVFLAGIFIVMVVSQLFMYERFSDVIDVLLSNVSLAMIASACVVTLEVAAIPFLLGMRLSPAARYVSMVAGWLTSVFWLVHSLVASIALGFYDNAGFLGDTVALPGGWWAVFFSLGLAVLTIWASWGMWPKRSRH